MIKIEIREEEGVPICGDGCCRDDGLMIDILINGELVDDEFYKTENKRETKRVVDLLKSIFGHDNVSFTQLKKNIN